MFSQTCACFSDIYIYIYLEREISWHKCTSSNYLIRDWHLDWDWLGTILAPCLGLDWDHFGTNWRRSWNLCYYWQIYSHANTILRINRSSFLGQMAEVSAFIYSVEKKKTNENVQIYICLYMFIADINIHSYKYNWLNEYTQSLSIYIHTHLKSIIWWLVFDVYPLC